MINNEAYVAVGDEKDERSVNRANAVNANNRLRIIIICRLLFAWMNKGEEKRSHSTDN